MKKKYIKKKKICILLAICAACIVTVTIYKRNRPKYCGPLLEEDSFVARYEYENISEDGTLFSYNNPIELEMRVGLWYKEGEPGQKPYMQISWENEKGPWKKTEPASQT